MDLGLDALSKLTVFSKYAKYVPELKRRETWEEIVARYESMMIKKYPKLESQIKETSQFILNKKVLPSMRALQFAGPAAEVNNSRICSCYWVVQEWAIVFRNNTLDSFQLLQSLVKLVTTSLRTALWDGQTLSRCS